MAYLSHQLSGLHAWQLDTACRALVQGNIIAYPTEAVYGLGCLPAAGPVEQLLKIKRRSVRKGLILIAATPLQLAPYVYFPDVDSCERVLPTWPGPVTWLLPARPGLPSWLTGEYSTLAVRVSAHPVVQALCLAAGPLISTSANPANQPPALNRQQLRSYFGSKLAYIVPGALGGRQRPTAILDGCSGQVVRSGG